MIGLGGVGEVGSGGGVGGWVGEGKGNARSARLNTKSGRRAFFLNFC